MLYEAFLLGLVAIPLFYLFSTWTHGHWKKRGVPYVEPVPVFGNVWDMLTFRKTFRELVLSIYERGVGQPVIGFYQFRKPVLLLRDPEVIKMVLVKEFSSFHDNSFVIHEDADPLGARNPFFLKGDRWKAVRSLLTPAFTAAKIRPQVPLMVTVCKDLVEYLEREAPKARPDGLEAKECAGRFTTDVVASCAFGIEGNSFKDKDAEIYKMGNALMTPTFWNNIQTTILIIMPFLSKIMKVRFINAEVSDFFRQIINQSVSYREENKVVRNDYLQMLIQIKTKGSVDDDSNTIRSGGIKIEYTAEDMAAHALTFFIDGYETSSIVLSFLLYELALSPEVQDRLRAEVSSVLKKQNGELSNDVIQHMVYLDMVLSETLRLHAPAPATDRLCTRTCELTLPTGGTIKLEKCATVLLPLEAIHTDPENFPEPMKFDPERFSEERKGSIKRFSYLPFGEGPRQCLGMRFAMTQIKVAVIGIISNFEVRRTAKTPVPLVLDPNSFLTVSKGGLWLDFVKRTTE